MYSTPWCGDCARAKMYFEKNNIKFTEIDIDQNESAAIKVTELNNGNRSVPTVVVTTNDGKLNVLTEPSWEELDAVFK